MHHTKNDTFLRACRRKKTDYTPVWIMRQAGRYLPHYRKVREKYDFITMCRTPEIAAEVTIQPVDVIGTDAAILFSDILVIPEAMGMNLVMSESKGPILTEPIKSEEDASRLKDIIPQEDLGYVLDAVKLVKSELNGRVPLIGFSGSPWTLLCYMVEGGGSKNFAKIKSMIYNNPALAHSILDKLSSSVAAYLSAKIEAGVDAVQIFDTWGGILSEKDYMEFSLPYIEKIIAGIKRDSQPVIFFAKGAHYKTRRISRCGADVLGLDWTMNLKKVKETTRGKIALQGNLDPCILLGDEIRIKSEVVSILKSYGPGTGHIFNLGHGILPETDYHKVKMFVSFVKEESKKYH